MFETKTIRNYFLKDTPLPHTPQKNTDSLAPKRIGIILFSETNSSYLSQIRFEQFATITLS